jgi:iron complex transport system substrate-binding protein
MSAVIAVIAAIGMIRTAVKHVRACRTKRRRGAVMLACVIAIAAASSIAASSNAASTTASAANATSSAVRETARAPQRIVSTSPTVTETLFALGLGDRVVGVSRYCRYPAAAAALPKIGTFLKPDAELIARLRPDLVVMHESHTVTAQRLTALSIPYVTVERGTIASVFSNILDIGAAAGVVDRATALIRDLEQQLARVRQSVSGRPPKRVLIIVGRRAGTLTDIVAAGRGTYLHDLAGIAGGVNVLDDPKLPEYPRISMETVIRLKPDVVIDAADMGDQFDDTRIRRTEALWAAQPLVTASKIRVHSVTGEAFTTPGPRVTNVARELARYLHGVDAR